MTAWELPAEDALSPNIRRHLWASVCTKEAQLSTGCLHLEYYYNQRQPRKPGVSFLQPGLPRQGARGASSAVSQTQRDEGGAKFKLGAGMDPV